MNKKILGLIAPVKIYMIDEIYNAIVDKFKRQ
jgi:hypothetical protein